jgi:hypothetical protein
MDEGPNKCLSKYCSTIITSLGKHLSEAQNGSRPSNKGPGLGILHRCIFLVCAATFYGVIGLGGWYLYQQGDLHLELWQGSATMGVAWFCALKSFEYYCSQHGTTMWG